MFGGLAMATMATVVTMGGVEAGRSAAFMKFSGNAYGMRRRGLFTVISRKAAITESLSSSLFSSLEGPVPTAGPSSFSRGSGKGLKPKLVHLHRSQLVLVIRLGQCCDQNVSQHGNTESV